MYCVGRAAGKTLLQVIAYTLHQRFKAVWPPAVASLHPVTNEHVGVIDERRSVYPPQQIEKECKAVISDAIVKHVSASTSVQMCVTCRSVSPSPRNKHLNCGSGH
jgi:hypothetical protein